MSQTNPERVSVKEALTSLRSSNLKGALKELLQRVSYEDLHISVTRSSGVITLVEFFADVGRTKKLFERSYSRGAFNRITGITTIFFNELGSEDSRVTTTVSRTDHVFDSNDNVFSITES